MLLHDSHPTRLHPGTVQTPRHVRCRQFVPAVTTRSVSLGANVLELRPGHCRVHLGTSDTKLLDNLRRRVILGYADPAPLQNHQNGNPTTTNGRPTREIVLV